MKKLLPIFLLLNGCSTGKLNPFSWFDIPETPVSDDPSIEYHKFAIKILAIALVVGIIDISIDKKPSWVTFFVICFGLAMSIWASIIGTIDTMLPWIIGAMCVVGIAGLIHKLYFKKWRYQ